VAQTLQAWSEEARKGTREEFQRRFPGWFLVVLEVPSVAAAEGAKQSIVATAKLPALKRGQTTAGPAPVLVHTVGKRPGLQSPFPTMITIGRAPNNDIVLQSQDVSTFHAHLANEDGRWVVRDADSTHGTFVNELAVRAPTPLTAGDTVRFGEVRCRIADAGVLYRMALFGV
jgi:hypothetical protein